VRFELTAQDAATRARAGRLTLRRGVVETPAFMPVGSRGSVRGLTAEHLVQCRAQILLANAFHLALRPGAETVARLGGLHAFMAWHGPILTDSGGYQAFSLARRRQVSDDGITFRSPYDGARVHLDPNECMRVQNLLGPDVAMVLDECTAYPCTRDEARRAVERTLRWSAACRAAHRRDDQALFGILQGGPYEDLRRESAARTAELDLDGYAIGGVSVGEPEQQRRTVVALTAPLLPADRPRYLMGVGFPLDVLAAVAEGIDLFDCVAPTRMGRNATAFTPDGRLRLRRSAFQQDPRPVQDGCGCVCCRLYSRACLNHLFRCGEMLGPVLLSIHNLTFYLNMMSDARRAISARRFGRFRAEFAHRYRHGVNTA
jgi:queuine tRNA-ribosyltransferase